MPRTTLLLIGICMIFASYGQNLPPKLEKGLINYNNDSTFALIQKGKKSGLYNLQSNQFEIQFDKRGKLLAQLGGYFYLMDEDKVTKYTAHTGILKKDCDSMNDSTDLCWEISKTLNGQFIITSFEVPGSWVGDKYGKDLVPDYSKSIQSTGVFDPTTMKWVLPNKFMKVYPFQNMLFAIKLDSEYIDAANPSRYAYSYTYHIFQEVKGKYEKIKTISKFDDAMVSEILGLDSIRKTEMDEQLYYGYRDRKIGIFYIDLNAKDLYFDYHLRLQEIVAPMFEFAYQISDRLFMTYQVEPEKLFNYFKIGIGEHYEFVLREARSDFPAMGIGSVGDFPVSNHAAMLRDSTDMCEQIFYTDYSRNYQIGLEYMNDSLMKIVSNYPGSIEAVRSIGWPGEDSIDWNGEVVYTLKGQSYNTGVYNLKANKWELQPHYKNVHFAGDHWIVRQVMELQEENTRYPEEEILVLDRDLNKLGNIINAKDYIFTGWYLANLFSPEAYTKVDLFGSEDLHQEFKGIHPVCTGVRPNGKMDLFAPGHYNFTPYMIKENVDFAFADPECYALFWLNSDTLMFSFFDTTYQVSGTECELIFEYDSKDGVARYSVLQISNLDTVKTQGRYVETTMQGEYTNRISLQLKGDQLIVNSCPTISTEILDPEYYEPMGWSVEEFGHSAIWQRTPKGFMRQTPYYAHIDPLPNGFIVSTPNYSSIPGWDEAYYQYPEKWFENQKRFLWLGDSLKAKEFVDYFDFELIEDLGFGLSLRTSKGSMFITYEGKMITSAEWEEFEVIEGRLRAFHSGLIRDENGEPKLDDTGEYLYAKEPITEYFDLPK